MHDTVHAVYSILYSTMLSNSSTECVLHEMCMYLSDSTMLRKPGDGLSVKIFDYKIDVDTEEVHSGI